jgi:hypothetical protein
MREKIKSLPVLGRLLTRIYECCAGIWQYITHKLLRKYISRTRWNKMKKEIIADFSDSEDNDIGELVHNIKKQGCIRTFNYPFYTKYKADMIKVFSDSEHEEYPYVIYSAGQTEKRVYFPKEWEPERIRKAYCQLQVEQDIDSPHCYQHRGYEVPDDAVVLDLGVAEGNFSVSIIDKVKHIYLFEGDSIWWEPLRLTFADWKEKVTLVPKYVSDTDDEQFISLNTFLKEAGLERDKVFIKMDIEGFEEKVLKGCREELEHMLCCQTDLTMAVCCYHRQSSEKDIRHILSNIGFKIIENSKGFMILNNFCEERVYPYFRRGILFVRAGEEER